MASESLGLDEATLTIDSSIGDCDLGRPGNVLLTWLDDAGAYRHNLAVLGEYHVCHTVGYWDIVLERVKLACIVRQHAKPAYQLLADIYMGCGVALVAALDFKGLLRRPKLFGQIVDDSIVNRNGDTLVLYGPRDKRVNSAFENLLEQAGHFLSIMSDVVARTS